VILVLRRSRRSNEFLRSAGASLEPNFPVEGDLALDRLGSGLDPTGSAIVLV